MNYKDLGNTGLKVSEIGIGTEFLFHQSKETASDVVNYAITNKINYFDILFTVQNYLEKIAVALKSHRNKIVIAGHLGTKDSEGRPKKTRKIEECKLEFPKILDILDIDCVDIINIQFVGLTDIPKLYDKNGLYELAQSFKKEGKAKFIGLSTHDINIANQAANTGKFDTIMFPFNLANHYLPNRAELLKTCLQKGVGLIAIKPLAAGRLMTRNRTTSIAKYQTGGISLKRKIPNDITSAQCINYVNSLKGVSVVLSGVKSIDELQENLKYSAPKEEKQDFTSLVEFFREKI
ncbi:MAG: aldo/keto reductase [Candidatus Lokiarchaeota archaeon]|nr:aldo/keto reductase [Candidatus Lokiarchaeota archaeon]